MSFRFLTIKDVRLETADTKSFVLETTDGTPLSYKPGQFLTLIVPDGKQEARRSYSFSSHPSEEFPVITVKRVPNGLVSRWLFDKAKPGDVIKTIGASGMFVLPEEFYDSLIFLAAGSGITPVISLIKEALLRNRPERIVLIYSNRSEQETIFHKEIIELQKRYPEKFMVEYFVGNSKDLRRARLGRTSLEEMVARYMTDPARTLFYLCGPHLYMQNITIALLTENVPDDNIRREIFFNPLPAATHTPPDRELHQVSVTYQGKKFMLPVQYPVSILKTALAKGILLPYSCESGRCGTCAATCVKGEVWMLRNEVLLDKEMSAGRVLTCTGFAVGGDAELIIE